ncbi:MAG: hypothetical protein U1E23_10515 [Reyranellaceae bacterium]
MAMFKDGNHLWQSGSDVFEDAVKPGSEALWTGIYACQECNLEIVATEGSPLPAERHHHHASGQPIRWRLIVYADQRPKSVFEFTRAA